MQLHAQISLPELLRGPMSTQTTTDDLFKVVSATKELLTGVLPKQDNIDAIEILPSKQKHLVLRVYLTGNGFETHRSIVVKHLRFEVSNQRPTGENIPNFYLELVGLTLVSDILKSQICPHLFGIDLANRLFVIEDFGKHSSSHQQNLQETFNDGEVLTSLANSLAQLHATTTALYKEYRQLCAQYGLRNVEQERLKRAEKFVNNAQKISNLSARLGIKIGDGFFHEVEAVAQTINDPGPFLVYTHNDLCPNNFFNIGKEVKLIDFELGGYQHAFLDACYGYMLFPACWCVAEIPLHIAEAATTRYVDKFVSNHRIELDARDFTKAMSHVCGFWALNELASLLSLPTAEIELWGLPHLERCVSNRLDRFIYISERANSLTNICKVVDKIRKQLTLRGVSGLSLTAAYKRSM